MRHNRKVTFLEFPVQNLTYGMRYNARDCGVQLSVNLISRLEEEGPTRLYACQSGFEPTTKRFESRALVSSATREALLQERIHIICASKETQNSKWPQTQFL